MASFVKTLSFFILLVLFTSLKIESSDRLFFSKVSGSNNNYNAKDPKIPLSYQQEAKPSPEVAALTTQAQKVAVDPPKTPSFSRNQYGGYGLFGSTYDTSAAIGTSSNSDNGKKNNNNGDNFIYNMESDFNGNGNGDDNIWDEIKQQGLSDTRSLENGRYIVDKNRFNGYDTARRGSTGNEGYDGKSGKQNEFDSLEEYEKYLQRTGYLP
ncbi:hypothetical protein ABKV19_020940 [Rosa sericea]